MKIAIDIDSTLHHYWDQLSGAAKRRFGVDLPYEQQVSWSIPELRPEQLRACVEETHSADKVLAATPYDGAVEVVAAWHDAGHEIHITSHRDPGCAAATTSWLDRIGLPYDELVCSYDKLSHCREAGIELLIDDSPANLAAALEAGMLAATIEHPWNRELREEEDIVSAPDWPRLAERLAPALNGQPSG